MGQRPGIYEVLTLHSLTRLQLKVANLTPELGEATRVATENTPRSHRHSTTLLQFHTASHLCLITTAAGGMCEGRCREGPATRLRTRVRAEPSPRSLPLSCSQTARPEPGRGNQAGGRLREGEAGERGQAELLEPRDSGPDRRYETSLETSRRRRTGTWASGRLVPSASAPGWRQG